MWSTLKILSYEFIQDDSFKVSRYVFVGSTELTFLDDSLYA